jgi:hypothetical protein
LYAAIACVTVLFIAVTVHFTWYDNVEGGTGLRPSDFLKVLIQNIQYLVIIGSVAVPWPKFMQGLFRASSVVFGVAAGQALSLDCWLAHYAPRSTSRLPKAMQLQLVQFLAPVLVFLALVMLQLLLWAMRTAAAAVVRSSTTADCDSQFCMQAEAVAKPLQLREYLRKLPLAALMVAYYAYPTLLRASLSFFACLRIDAPTGQPGVALLAHPHGYSILDIRQECFAGWHKGWALGLGVPAAILTCIGVPVGLLWLLKSHASMVDNQAFREHFGFLYRNYAPGKTWWEAVWAAQTVLLSWVAAFHFRLEAYFSMLLLASIFALSAALQGIFKPYMVHKLHSAHYASTACLFVTCLGALTMFPVDNPPESVATVHAAITTMVIIDSAFVLFCIHATVMASSGSFKAVYVRMAARVGWGPCVHGPQLQASSAAACIVAWGKLGHGQQQRAESLQPADSAASLRGPSARSRWPHECADTVGSAQAKEPV